ncbi:hypothetical protein Clopa_4597 [Clostridium pasteurianum BC1]|uniref:Uncharacterized protein n=1 Tax=Clostridium pasteurianum BC1 TaxID=86416 RepID=R4KI46_CLOPA|nr:hypothetical protein Clopa_4597 [Clostridium pasteurianum BC1]
MRYGILFSNIMIFQNNLKFSPTLKDILYN